VLKAAAKEPSPHLQPYLPQGMASEWWSASVTKWLDCGIPTHPRYHLPLRSMPPTPPAPSRPRRFTHSRPLKQVCGGTPAPSVCIPVQPFPSHHVHFRIPCPSPIAEEVLKSQKLHMCTHPRSRTFKPVRTNSAAARAIPPSDLKLFELCVCSWVRARACVFVCLCVRM
jgi:hypothetical protein